MAWNDETIDFEAAVAPLSDYESNYYQPGGGADFDYGPPALAQEDLNVSTQGVSNGEDYSSAAAEYSDIFSQLSSPQSPLKSGSILDIAGANSIDELTAKAGAAYQASKSGDGTATEWLKGLTDKLGDKAVAALIQGGFGILGGYSQGKTLEKQWDIQKQRRDEEWARREKNSYAGSVAPMKWGGGILSAAK